MNKYMADYMSLHCNACGKDVFKEKGDYFMLKDEIWEEVKAELKEKRDG